MIQYNYFKLFQIILNKNRGDEGVLSTLSTVLENFRNSTHSDKVKFFKNSVLFGALSGKNTQTFTKSIIQLFGLFRLC